MEAKRGPLRYLAAVGIGVTVALAIETGGMAALAVLACAACVGITAYAAANAPPPTGTDCAL